MVLELTQKKRSKKKDQKASWINDLFFFIYFKSKDISLPFFFKKKPKYPWSIK